MHIVTGLLLTHLLGKAKSGKSETRSPLLRIHEPVRLKHIIPGRVRFSISYLQNQENICRQLSEQLLKITAINQVTVDPLTGSVLIKFDQDHIKPDMLVAALIRMLGLEKELEKEPAPKITSEIRSLGKSLNRVVYDQSGGLLDLKTALFLAIALIGIRKIITDRTLATPTGFTLLWWAGNSIFGNKAAKQ